MAYERHTWVCGETITADLLNNIEDGIEAALECCGGGTDTVTVTFGICDRETGENVPFQTIGDYGEEGCQNKRSNPIEVPRGTAVNYPTCGIDAEGAEISNMGGGNWYLGKVEADKEMVSFPYTVTEDTVFTYCEPLEG